MHGQCVAQPGQVIAPYGRGEQVSTANFIDVYLGVGGHV
jgi:hypothetical protein